MSALYMEVTPVAIDYESPPIISIDENEFFEFSKGYGVTIDQYKLFDTIIQLRPAIVVDVDDDLETAMDQTNSSQYLFELPENTQSTQVESSQGELSSEPHYMPIYIPSSQ